MSWEIGTDLRTEGIYRLPAGVNPPVPTEYDEFVSVTHCLDLVTDLVWPHCWFIADFVHDLADSARTKKLVPVWIEDPERPGKGKQIEVNAARILLNDIDSETGGKNFGKHWIKLAGMREMRRRANRGTVIHKAVEDYILRDLRVIKGGPVETRDYVGTLIEEGDFALTADYCLESVKSALMWLDAFLIEPIWCEAPIFNFTYGFAGTGDLGAKLRFDDDHSSIWGIDFKGSASGPKPQHRKQAAAYGCGEFILIQGTNVWVPMPKIDRYANVYATETGAECHEWFGENDPYTLEEAFTAFLHTVALRHYYDREGSTTETNRLRSLSIKRPTAGEIAEMKARAKAARG